MNESMKEPRFESGGIVGKDEKTFSADSPEFIIPITKKDAKKMSAVRISNFLSPPPSIEQRLYAALHDEHGYQVIYYNRCEGATHAIAKLAKDNERIMVAGVTGHKSYYREAGVPYKDYQELISSHSMSLRGVQAVILDVVPENALSKLRDSILRFGCKLIVIKSI